MIAQLTGEVVRKDGRGIVLNVGGVGYRVHVVKEHGEQMKIGANISLLTHLSVRETALDLYGFENTEMLNYFELLITVPGIGPKSALAVLSLAAPEVLRRAILADDTTYLTRVSGIGRKSAEKIIVTLKDKLGGLDHGESSLLAGEVEAMEALQGLGYTLAEARAALKLVPTGIVEVGAKVKAALQRLGRK
ncbi:MAG: Holliday junction branch migration protein RuvA [Patescibacteria group bacterium]